MKHHLAELTNELFFSSSLLESAGENFLVMDMTIDNQKWSTLWDEIRGLSL